MTTNLSILSKTNENDIQPFLVALVVLALIDFCSIPKLFLLLGY